MLSHKRKLYIVVASLLTLSFGLYTTHLTAQQSVNAAGGNAQHDSGSISFSVGQVVDEYFFSKEGSTSEGVQQPYELFSSSVGILNITASSIFVTPNPFRDYITVHSSGTPAGQFYFTLYDLSGSLHAAGTASANQQIDLSHLPSGIYFISFQRADHPVSTHILLKP